MSLGPASRIRPGARGSSRTAAAAWTRWRAPSRERTPVSLEAVETRIDAEAPEQAECQVVLCLAGGEKRAGAGQKRISAVDPGGAHRQRPARPMPDEPSPRTPVMRRPP